MTGNQVDSNNNPVILTNGGKVDAGLLVTEIQKNMSTALTLSATPGGRDISLCVPSDKSNNDKDSGDLEMFILMILVPMTV
ncbi:hypothetical protein EYZ11_002621 [Aspergillus tanneri]|uniref:Uncharacterized protein n=1 Tax=Aspergillus tanneri TaxID=1220188 RepID=A0A4S3JQC4_9EURO|nr:hypothetical protein EYZ11_002621 [Aspergillus tanneri]